MGGGGSSPDEASGGFRRGMDSRSSSRCARPEPGSGPPAAPLIHPHAAGRPGSRSGRHDWAAHTPGARTPQSSADSAECHRGAVSGRRHYASCAGHSVAACLRGGAAACGGPAASPPSIGPAHAPGLRVLSGCPAESAGAARRTQHARTCRHAGERQRPRPCLQNLGVSGHWNLASSSRCPQPPSKQPADSPCKHPADSPNKRPEGLPSKRSPSKQSTVSPCKHPAEPDNRHPADLPSRRPTDLPNRRSPSKHPADSPSRRPASCFAGHSQLTRISGRVPSSKEAQSPGKGGAATGRTAGISWRDTVA